MPVLNKMDLPNADPDNAKAEVEDVIGIDATDAIPCSAKTGLGIDEILEKTVTWKRKFSTRWTSKKNVG